MSDNNLDDFTLASKGLDELIEEAIQIYELDKEKTNIIDELYNSLRTIAEYLGFSIDIEPKLLNLPQETRVILMPSLDLLIIKSNFKSEQKRLDQLNLDELSSILKLIIPNMVNMAKADIILKNQKIAFVREATNKLKRLSNSNDEVVVNDMPLPMGGI